MAGKQLGKLRQWAGEVIAVREKTVVSDEFRELEHDVELRRRGLWRLHVATEDYHHVVSKKKVSEVLEGEEKLLPIDALGVVMIQHGEEFGDDSAFGTSLVSLGKAHCQIATLQEAFSLTLQESYLASIQRAEDDIKEYQVQRKKLESRRLAYDAAIVKAEKMKNSKKEKEKDKMEAEDEYLRAKSRYEECSEDVRARMYAIQENELDQLRDLTSFLDMELHFVEQYLEVLRETRAGWIDEETLAQIESSKKKRPTPPPPSVDESRFSSLRSRKSISRKSRAGSDDTDSDDGNTRTRSAPGSRAPSRPQSRAERKRADSVVSNATEKEKDKEKPEKKRLSVAGWASSKVSSITGRGKKEKESIMKDQDDMDSDSDDSEELGRRKSAPSSSRASPTKNRPSRNGTPTASPIIPSRPLKLPSQGGKKIAIALHDFSAGSSDELTFKTGDHIIVLNEVLDGWWMGELGGKKGLFPTTYTEIVNSSTSSLVSKPPLPRRPSMGLQLPVQPSRSSPSPQSSIEEPKSKSTPRWLDHQVTGELSIASEDDHPFGDNFIASSRSPLNGTFYAESIADSGDEYEPEDHQDERLVPAQTDSDDNGDGDIRRDGKLASPTGPPPVPSRRLSIPGPKKPPPPPPPRRTNTSNASSLNVPSVPARAAGVSPSNSSSRSNSTNTSFGSVPAASVLPHLDDGGLTNSPFDSPKDTSGCDAFKQNLFKPRGMCSNCFQMHHT